MLSRVSNNLNRSAFARRAFASKIKVAQPVCDLDGDEMTRIIWDKIKDTHINPYLDLNIQYFDLSV
jgi:isocitrate dehydrogenase